MAADDNLRVNPQVMQGFAQGLLGAAEGLRNQLSELDGQIGELLGGWRGASGDAYGSAWEKWHRGAIEVEQGLSMLANAVGHAGKGYQQNEAADRRGRADDRISALCGEHALRNRFSG